MKDDERKSGKRDKKDKLKKEKISDKHSKRHSDKDRKSDQKHKGKRKKHDSHLKHDFQELSNDDYFSKNNEFAAWLKEKKRVFFSDLPSDSARELFSDFVKEWNNQKLDTRYYEGIASGPRTAHNWKIRN